VLDRIAQRLAVTPVPPSGAVTTVPVNSGNA